MKSQDSFRAGSEFGAPIAWLLKRRFHVRQVDHGLHLRVKVLLIKETIPVVGRPRGDVAGPFDFYPLDRGIYFQVLAAVGVSGPWPAVGNNAFVVKPRPGAPGARWIHGDGHGIRGQHPAWFGL